MTDQAPTPAPAAMASRAGRLLCVLGLLWVAAAAFVFLAVGEFACNTDTAYCAARHDKNGYYRGRLNDADGQPLRSTSFLVYFDSLRSSRGVGPFRTDHDGRYCFVWASESTTPNADPEGARSITIRDPWRPLRGRPAPTRCQRTDVGIPWKRAADLTDRWQYRLPLAALALTALVLLAGLVRAGTRVGQQLRQVGLWLAAASSLVAVMVWA